MFVHCHRSHMLFMALLATELSFAPMPAWNMANAGSTNTKIIVSAKVLARTSLKIIHQIKEIIITSTDIRKGYIDIKNALHIEIKSNNTAGYMLTFQGITWPFKEIDVQGLASKIRISPGITFIYQPYNRGVMTIELDCQLFLNEDAQPGIYNWPLSISSQPI